MGRCTAVRRAVRRRTVVWRGVSRRAVSRRTVRSRAVARVHGLSNPAPASAPTPTSTPVAWRARRALVAAGAVLCAAVAAVALPGQTAVAAPPSSAPTPRPYDFTEDATTVKGATGTTGAVRLVPGRTYRSAVKKNATLYYGLPLDDTSDAYVSATAVPRPGTTVAFSDGVKVSLRDGNGRSCSGSGIAHIGATQSPHPITASTAREIGSAGSVGSALCQAAGTYYVVVERTGSPGVGDSGDWDLELRLSTEPRLKKAGTPSAPEVWDSASPDPLSGEATACRGGAGFTTATALRQGIWTDGISPGQTLFYRVPVDWGQQFYATADLSSSSSSGGGKGAVGTALVMSLYNPARGFVDDAGLGYYGRQGSAALEPLPPVDYANRYALNDRVSGMRFAGSYYVVVHLAEQVAERFGEGPFGLTLRVRVAGTAKNGPAYAGRTQPRDLFDVTAVGPGPVVGDRRDDGLIQGTSPGGGGGSTMKLVAVGGIGTGTFLVLALAVWAALARRRITPEPSPTAHTATAVPARRGHRAARRR